MDSQPDISLLPVADDDVPMVDGIPEQGNGAATPTSHGSGAEEGRVVELFGNSDDRSGDGDDNDSGKDATEAILKTRWQMSPWPQS